MYIGPIHPQLAGVAGTPGHSPIKNTKISTNLGHEQLLFDSTYPLPISSDVPEQDFTTMVWETSQALAIARLMQIKELHQNQEWQRCGLFIIWREDGVNDPEDGWYVIRDTDIHEDLLVAGYSAPQISVELRDRLGVSIGAFVDQKAQPNDANLGGTTLACLPMGFSNPYPQPLSFALQSSDGALTVFENTTSVIRAAFVSPVNTMTLGRCKAFDQNTNRSTQTEVFWKDHRNQNGWWEFNNGLLRYYFQENAAASPAIDIWDATTSAWITLGNYQLQTVNAANDLPLQSIQISVISPEEIVWTERRYGTASTAMVMVQNRIRRGSRLIESLIVAASGAGLTGTQSVGIVNAPAIGGTYAVVASADGTGVVLQSTPVPFTDGFETAAAISTAFQGVGTSAKEGAAVLTDWVQARGAWSKAANIISAPVTAGQNQLIYGSAGPIVGGLDSSKWIRQVRINAGQIGAGITGYQQSLDNSYVVKLNGANTVGLYKNVAGTLTQLGASLSFTWTAGAAVWLEIDLTVAGTVTFGAATDTAGAPGAFTTQSQADTTYSSGGFGYYNDGTGTVPTFGGAFANVDRVQTDLKGWTFFNDAGCNYDGFSYMVYVTSQNQTFPYAGGSATVYNGLVSAAVFIPAAGNVSTTNRAGFTRSDGIATSVAETATVWGKAPNGANWCLFGHGLGTTTILGNGSWQRGTQAGTFTVAVYDIAGAAAGTFYFDNAEVYQTPVVAGFAYLTSAPNAASVSGTSFYSGSTVPAGTITRLGIICGALDDQFISLKTLALYAAKWASYNRTRVRQRILVGTSVQ